MTSLIIPVIRKARLIKGKTLVLRDATPLDAEFILSLRTDSNKAQHLSRTDHNLDAQIKWLTAYTRDSGQAYFIIEDHDRHPLGTIRIYDARQDSFCWGSWILKDGAPTHAAIESALIIYAYSINHLGFNRAHFDVRKANEHVWRFHERFGARRIKETHDDYFYTLSADMIATAQRRYQRFLPTPLTITE